MRLAVKKDYKTIRNAFMKTEKVLASASGLATRQTNINTSSILDILIREAGRWTERFASDLFITWNTIESIIHGSDCRSDMDKIIIFAMRRDGVDSNEFFMCRITDGITEMNPWLNKSVYRRILALQVKSKDGIHCDLVLKDIENELLKLDPEDKANDD